MKKSLINNFCLGLAFVFPVLLHADTYTFSSAGASGREGPTQSQIDANYSGTNLNGTVTINTQGIQEWTVPEEGESSSREASN